MAFLLSSCLKDKGFEDGKYGTVNRNVEGQEWVSIPLAARTSRTISLESRPGSQSIELFSLSYDYKEPVASEFTVNLQVNNSLLSSYSNVTALPTNAYTGTTSVTFKQGQRISDPLKLSISTDALDPSKVYGIGLTIASVTKTGVQIPSNLKNMIVFFTVKNEYDGEYDVTGYFFHPTAGRAIKATKKLSTVGKNRSMASMLGDLAGWEFAFDVDANRKLTNWEAMGSTPPKGQPGSSGFMENDNPGGTTFAGTAQPGVGEWVSSKYNNTYDPTTKTFWMHYGYVAGVVGDEKAYTRQIYEKWVRK